MTPCILPWINYSTNTYSRSRACGYSDLGVVKENKKLKDSDITTEWNSEYFKTIRRDFINGNWPENCKRCAYVESLGGKSKRIHENKAYYDQYKDLIEQTEADGTLNVMPQHIDVRTGTTCNQKCIHCGTGVSSKWREDKELFGLYPNTENAEWLDDRWIDRDTDFWDYLAENIKYFKRYNFLGGESFANKRHNEYLQLLSESEYACDIELQYVTNATLLTQQRLEQLAKFKRVNLRLSVDAHGEAGEYFRFPMKWDSFMDKARLVDTFAKTHPHLDVAFQWTCSNISMFYFDETYKILCDNFKHIYIIFSNHVEFPKHMSAQNLPNKLKDEIAARINAVTWREENDGYIDFYINHMMAKDLWPEQGEVFLNYLDDLDRVRKCDWHSSFKEMELEKYDVRAK